MKKKLSAEQKNNLLNTIQVRFEKNMHRHKAVDWKKVVARLETKPEKLWSLYKMEETGGEPDVVGFDKKTSEYIFYDCAVETPKGRRSICYDHEALEARKENKPLNSAMQMALDMGVELLTEEQYRELQSLQPVKEKLDTKTSSWLKTPADIRKLGGAIFGDYRYGQVFIYHNGAESYYGVRGFRSCLRV